MPERFWQELSTAACKADAHVVMERYTDAIKALDEDTSESVLAQAQDIIRELPD